MRLELIQQYYEDDHPQRHSELVYVLSRNLGSGVFDRVRLLAEGPCPSLAPFFPQVVPDDIGRRMRYADALARCTDKDTIYVIANNDIVFDETVRRLRAVKCWDHLLVSITRFDLSPEGEIRDYRVEHRNTKIHLRSHDAWAVRGHPDSERHFAFTRIEPIELGRWGCECVLAKSATDSGWRVYNAHPDVRALHVHWSMLRRTHHGMPEHSYRLQGVPTRELTESDRLFCGGVSRV